MYILYTLRYIACVYLIHEPCARNLLKKLPKKARVVKKTGARHESFCSYSRKRAGVDIRKGDIVFETNSFICLRRRRSRTSPARGKKHQTTCARVDGGGEGGGGKNTSKHMRPSFFLLLPRRWFARKIHMMEKLVSRHTPV